MFAVQPKYINSLSLFSDSEVSVRLSISPKPTEGYYVTGSKVILTCYAPGFPLTHYLKLSKDQQVIAEYKNKYIPGVYKDISSVMYTHKIPALALSDSGSYECEAEQKINGRNISNNKKINIEICMSLGITYIYPNTVVAAILVVTYNKHRSLFQLKV